MRTQGGYTLLELLVATGVALVLVGTAVAVSVSARQEARTQQIAQLTSQVVRAVREQFGAGDYSTLASGTISSTNSSLSQAFRTPIPTPEGGGDFGRFDVAGASIRVAPGTEVRGPGGLPMEVFDNSSFSVILTGLSAQACTDIGLQYLTEAQVIRVRATAGGEVVVRTDAGAAASGAAGVLASTCGRSGRSLELLFL